MKDMKMSSDTVRFCTDDQGVFLNPQGVDSMAVAPAALRIPRHLQATLAFVAVAVVSSLVALFVVDHCIFGEIDEVKEAFQMFKSHMENCSTSQREIQMLMCRVNDVRSQLRVLCGDYPGNTSTDVQTKKGSLWATSVDNTSAEIQVLRGHWEGAASDIHLLKGELETVTAQTRLAIGHLGQIDGQFQVLKAQLEDVNGLNSQIQVLGGQLNNASREIETLRQGMQAAEALGSKTQALESGLKQASAEIQRLRGDLESTRALTGGLAEQQSRLETLSAAVASQERLQKNQTQLLQLFLQGWKLDRGNLYYFSHVKKSWHEAEQFCASHGAHLASVTSEEEQAFLRQFTSSLYHWIGLTDSGMEGSWRWTDGTPFSSSRSTTFWDKNQPDNWRHSNGQAEDCVQMLQKWNDMDCGASFHWVCKKPKGGQS
ncbi:C-type lectin domain family 4 member F isoform X1 [Oryctolagus cuniculus]|uniref:C-type lectin domain family 4 member F isoform X1 n=2 Tax=Oryctolagus cuniculus TaxID=9986 RepID=UPI003879A218